MVVGQVTVRRDEPAVARTGVTVILPKPVKELLEHPVPAGTAVLNGAGELTGSIQIREWGVLETPVYLTSTHAVGRVMDAAVEVAVEADAVGRHGRRRDPGRRRVRRQLAERRADSCTSPPTT